MFPKWSVWRHGLLISRSRWSCRVTLREMTVCGELCGEGSPASVRQAPSSVPLGCHASPSLLRAPDVLPCSIPSPSQHPSHVSPSLPRLDFDSFLSLDFLFRRDSPRLPVRDTSLNTRLRFTRDIHDLDSTHFNTLPATLSRILSRFHFCPAFLFLFYYGAFHSYFPPLMLFPPFPFL